MQSKTLKILFFVLSIVSILSVFTADVLVDFAEKAPLLEILGDVTLDVVLLFGAVLFGYLFHKIRSVKT